jgi:hypothetical protein
VNIQGAQVGVWTPIKGGDIRDEYGSAPGVIRIEEAVLRNHTNILTTMPYGVTGGGVGLPPRRVELHRVLFGDVPADTGPMPQADIRPEYRLDYGPNLNAIVSNRIIVTDHNRITGQNFEVFQEEQAPTFIVPQTGSIPGLVGAPVGGLTNQQAWSQFGIAVSGAVAPCLDRRERIAGFACGIRGPSPAVSTSVIRSAMIWPVAGVMLLALFAAFAWLAGERNRPRVTRAAAR